MVVKLHHVEFLCNNIQKRLLKFCGAFGFKPFAEAFFPRRVAIKRNSIYFVLTENNTPRDTISNVTFEVENVDHTTTHVQNNGGNILISPTTLTDFEGQTISSVIQTPCGNVLHTLLDKSNYGGLFLPGFRPLSGSTMEILPNKCLEFSKGEDLITHIDHIAFGCHHGTSLKIIDWYNKCLGFTRFRVNADERADGYEVSSLVNGMFVGMRLSAMQYWKCSEFGVELSASDSKNNVKFVLAEPLPGQGPSQIQTFLNEHGGPGVQHIGLHSTDMVGAVEELKHNGVEFIMPPNTYYTQPNKIQEIFSAGCAVDSLQKQGILLDAESFTSEGNNETKYLMQVFTKPLFEENTFFMEVIQRFGATGFGSGNITALWRALDEHLKQSQNNTETCRKNTENL